jgi:hypothetical protein
MTSDRALTLPAILIAASLLGSGALAQPSPPKAGTPAKPEAAPAAAAPEAKSGGSEDSFTLENSLNVRDPFRRLLAKGALGLEGVNIPPLERYELDAYKLLGIITGPRKNKALVSDPDGKLHVVSEEMYIGIRHGKIVHIEPGQLVIEEKAVNILGQEEKVEAILAFPSDDNKEGKK